MAEVKVTVSGPLFEGDPSGIVREEAHGMLVELVEKGEERLAQMLRTRPAGVFLSVAEAGKRASTGHYRSNLTSMVRDLHGLITDGGVIYGPWLEGVSSRNATTRFKGYASFRRTGQWLQKQVPAVMQRRMARLVRRLGG